MVFGIMVDWECRAVRSETAAVPSALETGAPRDLCSALKERRCYKSARLGGYTLPRHLSQPLLPHKKDRPKRLGGIGWKGFAYYGIGSVFREEAGQCRGLQHPHDRVTLEPGDSVRRGTTREATVRVT